MDTRPVNSSAPSRYIYGTTRLGDSKIAFDDRVAMARSAIESGLWLHTSDQYGDALSVLKTAIGLSQFIDVAAQAEPLAEEIQQELLTLQRRWSDDHDRHAKPWSM